MKAFQQPQCLSLTFTPWMPQQRNSDAQKTRDLVHTYCFTKVCWRLAKAMDKATNDTLEISYGHQFHSRLLCIWPHPCWWAGESSRRYPSAWALAIHVGDLKEVQDPVFNVAQRRSLCTINGECLSLSFCICVSPLLLHLKLWLSSKKGHHIFYTKRIYRNLKYKLTWFSNIFKLDNSHVIQKASSQNVWFGVWYCSRKTCNYPS